VSSTDQLWEALLALPDDDRQRALLETFVRLHLTVTSMKKWTHAQSIMNTPNAVRWRMLDADDDGIREEKEIEFGSLADKVVRAVLGKFVREQPWETARLTIVFSPPTLQIDVLNQTNTPIFSGKLIDMDMEAQIRSQLRLNITEE